MSPLTPPFPPKHDPAAMVTSAGLVLDAVWGAQGRDGLESGHGDWREPLHAKIESGLPVPGENIALGCIDRVSERDKQELGRGERGELVIELPSQ